MTTDEILRLFPWSAPKLVPTRFGPRLVRCVEALSDVDRQTFFANEAALRKRSVILDTNGLFRKLTWWQKVKEEVPPELIAKTEVREISNNELTQACKEVEAQGGRITALDHLKGGYRLTISWPEEKGKA